MQAPAISIERLSRSFGAIKALDNLSLEVPAGIVFGFLGPNGAGKSTTIRLLLGLLAPTGGQARVLGFDSRTQANAIRARCGALLEFAGLYERMSAQDNLDLYGRIYGMPAPARRARIKELLTGLELWERRREVVAGWSRGMKQKLAVARALFHHPSLVFLDEPTAGFDPMAAAAFRGELASLAAREGVTVFLTTHNLSEAEKLCARVGVIRQGSLLAVGSSDELKARTASPQAEIVGRGFTEQALLLNLLTSLLAASGGILISLRAATVRQAQQTLVLCTVGLVACTIFAARAAASWAALASPASAARVWLIVAATLAVLDAILLGATFLRFQRSRLIL